MADARILIVDDHPVVREGMAPLISQHDGLTVTGQAPNAQEALRQLRAESGFDLAIVDLALEGLDGLELIKKIKAEFEALPVLVLSMQDEQVYAGRAVAAGASGFVSKEVAIPQVVEAIRTVLAGDVFLTEASGLQDDASSLIKNLSDRELEVFHSLGEGRGTRETGDALSISVKTVESHRANIKRKLDIEDATELTRRATLWVQLSRSR